MTHLTGPPRIGGILLPRPSLDTPTRIEWTPEHITKTMRSGAVRVVETRYRCRVTMGWTHLPIDTVHVLLSELRSGVATVAPRTKAPTDPDWAEEVTMAMRVTSALPSAAQLWTAPTTLPLTLEMESLATFDSPAGIVYGGFYAEVGPDPGTAALTPYGMATLAPGPDHVVAFRGSAYTLPTAVLGTDAIVALRTSTPEGQDGFALPTLTIDTTTPPE